MLLMISVNGSFSRKTVQLIGIISQMMQAQLKTVLCSTTFCALGLFQEPPTASVLLWQHGDQGKREENLMAIMPGVYLALSGIHHIQYNIDVNSLPDSAHTELTQGLCTNLRDRKKKIQSLPSRCSFSWGRTTHKSLSCVIVQRSHQHLT